MEQDEQIQLRNYKCITFIVYFQLWSNYPWHFIPIFFYMHHFEFKTALPCARNKFIMHMHENACKGKWKNQQFLIVILLTYFVLDKEWRFNKNKCQKLLFLCLFCRFITVFLLLRNLMYVSYIFKREELWNRPAFCFTFPHVYWVFFYCHGHFQ